MPVFNAGLQKMFISLQASQNFPSLTKFPSNMAYMYFFILISQNKKKLPSKELPDLPIFFAAMFKIF